MSVRPLILILDDKAAARESMRELFESIDCSVITVSTDETALKEIQARDDINLLVTDMNLRTDAKDKSGLVFSRIVRSIRPDIPIAAYSARVKDLSISPADYRSFDLFLDKGTDDPNKVMNFVQECKTYAITYKDISEKLLSSTGKKSGGFAYQNDVDERISRIEREMITKGAVMGMFKTGYIIFGIAAGIASIWGLFLTIR